MSSATIVMLLLAVAPAANAATNRQLLLRDAVREYRAALECPDRDQRLQRFHRAELIFARLIEGRPGGQAGSLPGIRNANLYVNLGNAALGA